MKISTRDLSIVMVLIGLISAFAVYQFVFTSKMTEYDELKAQCDSMESEVESLEAVGNMEQEYVTTSMNNEKKLADLVKTYPTMYRYEDGIMYLYNYEQRTDMGITFQSYDVTESGITDVYTGRVNGNEKTYTYGAANIMANFQIATYEDMKKFVSSVYEDKQPKNIEQISLAFNNTDGTISGTINLNMFSLSDGTNKYVAPEIPKVEMKPDCIFGPIVAPEDIEE